MIHVGPSKHRRALDWLLVVAAVVAIVGIVAPHPLQDHPHWDKVGWFPFFSPPVPPLDMLANILLFIPLGWAVGRLSARPSIARAVLVAAGISLTIEWIQLYSHDRFPSATDFVCNTVGGFAGGQIALRAAGSEPSK
jgi:hypothetical protein